MILITNENHVFAQSSDLPLSRSEVDTARVINFAISDARIEYLTQRRLTFAADVKTTFSFEEALHPIGVVLNFEDIKTLVLGIRSNPEIL
jgi:hypothetical protein